MGSGTGVLDGAVAAIVRLGSVELADLPDTVCLQLLRELGVLGNMVDAQLTRLVGRVHTRGAAVADGAVSTQAWLRARLHTVEAGAQVRAAKTLVRTPRLAEAYVRGEVSLAHVGQVAAVVDDLSPELLAGGVDQLLTEQAMQHPPAVFARAVVLIRDFVDPDAAERHHRALATERWLQADVTFGGAVAVRGVLDPEAGQLLRATLFALTPTPQVGDARTGAQRRADALVDLCRLATHHAPTTGGERPHVAVTVDLATLQTGLAASHATGLAMSQATGPAAPTRPGGPRPLTGSGRPHRSAGSDGPRWPVSSDGALGLGRAWATTPRSAPTPPDGSPATR
jgi:hypothetical protein